MTLERGSEREASRRRMKTATSKRHVLRIGHIIQVAVGGGEREAVNGADVTSGFLEGPAPCASWLNEDPHAREQALGTVGTFRSVDL